MAILAYIPLFGIILVVYNVMMIMGVDFNSIVFDMSSQATEGQATSQAFHVGDVIVMLGVVCLYIEVIKATRASMASVIDHVVSLIVFIIFLIELILVKSATTPDFLILTLMSLLDVIAGFTITISSAKRDVSIH
ncbi:MAG: hypothetical protein BWK79_16480 [Beggiatoa sp. IS2]|nr:MAG: hypothetical protein BWK79_16480 [Beggiatoa sp. IS2]